MKSINSLLMRVAKRAEKSVPEHLVKSFVDVGPLFATLSSNDNQIIFGRRGTGKTHLLYYLDSNLREQGIVSVTLDMRVVGSSGGFYGDRKLPLSVRGTRLLSDTLCCIHESLRQIVVANDSLLDTGVLECLDEFIEQSTNIVIQGETELGHSRVSDREQQKNASIGYSGGPLFELSEKSYRNLKHEDSLSRKGKEEIRIHFSTVVKVLQSIVSKLHGKQLWILIDEWSELPLDLQPYLADLLRRTVLPVRGVTLKVAAIQHRSNFRVHNSENSSYIGIEVGADASSVIDLDDFMVFDNNSELAKGFFKNLLYKHALALGLKAVDYPTADKFINEVFTQYPAFEEFARASEGIPRDAISIVGIAAQKAVDNKLSIALVRESARDSFYRNKHEAIKNMSEILNLLDWIVHEVIKNRQTRGFLLASGVKDELIDYLYDARILHLLKQGISAANVPGKRFNLYAIDYGCYVDLMSTKSAPKGLLMDESVMSFCDVPKNDYRSIRSSVLNLDDFYRVGRLPLYEAMSDICQPTSTLSREAKAERVVDLDFIQRVKKVIEQEKKWESVYVPLIFAALVIRLAHGSTHSRGSEITREINSHLVDSGIQKKSNNISRELREDYFLAQKWLFRDIRDDVKFFSLSVDWEKYWFELFGFDAPIIKFDNDVQILSS
ncbi:hypothetical protein [Rheinheimera hassiensis]|uniref:ORC-CDC6 family AAA ATPase n=1 Tax=Rheinheimera hassiensis TaxID=1193627 RepID=UPI001F0684D8|nr:hypothetical protein [Rheinheimera hassiensis]